MSLLPETEYDGILGADAPTTRRLPSRPSMGLVTLFCAAAVGFALVGAAYAVDSPGGLGNEATKGDRIAESIPQPGSVTIEDANVDAGFSNLFQLDSATPSGVLR